MGLLFCAGVAEATSATLGFGEDLSFCGRVQQVGGEMWCDSSIKMGHVGLGTITESVFLSQGGFHELVESGENGTEGDNDSV